MTLINTNLKMLWIVLSAALLIGCATQATILPASDKQMVDIYRDAIAENYAPSKTTLEPDGICESLDLDEPVDSCRQKVSAHASRTYRQIDSGETSQSLEYIDYTRSVATELDNLFPQLDNPELVIYVYPHLATRTRTPIPGYSTVLPLYERVEYRLPGESLLATPQITHTLAAPQEVAP